MVVLSLSATVLGVARKVNIAGVSKSLAECTIADVELMANGARPAAVGLGRELTQEAMWAHMEGRLSSDRGDRPGVRRGSAWEGCVGGSRGATS
jgi:hypothetical protein